MLVHKACFSSVIFDLFKQNELKDKVTLDENKVDTETLPGKLSKYCHIISEGIISLSRS